jgi:DNA mismatch endonuclease (patch repair protein)
MPKRKRKRTRTRNRRTNEVDVALQRSATMRAVKPQDTAPEIAVRKMARQFRHRPRLNDATLPGSPDLVFPALKKAIFVHGCFWHGHSCMRGHRVPKTNRDYWINKVSRNRRRDRLATHALRQLGWECLVIWECTTRDTTKLSARLRGFLA